MPMIGRDRGSTGSLVSPTGGSHEDVPRPVTPSLRDLTLRPARPQPAPSRRGCSAITGRVPSRATVCALIVLMTSCSSPMSNDGGPPDTSDGGRPGIAVSIETDGADNCVLTRDRRVICWGSLTSTQNADLSVSPGPPLTYDGPIDEVSVGIPVCLRTGNSVRCECNPAWFCANDTVRASPMFHPPAEPLAAVAASTNTACGLRPNGTIVCWPGGGSDPGGAGPRHIDHHGRRRSLRVGRDHRDVLASGRCGARRPHSSHIDPTVLRCSRRDQPGGGDHLRPRGLWPPSVEHVSSSRIAGTVGSSRALGKRMVTLRVALFRRVPVLGLHLRSHDPPCR